MSHLLNSLSCLQDSEQNQEMLVVVGTAVNLGYLLL